MTCYVFLCGETVVIRKHNVMKITTYEGDSSGRDFTVQGRPTSLARLTVLTVGLGGLCCLDLFSLPHNFFPVRRLDIN